MGQGDSKLEFRSRVQVLSQRPVEGSDHDFWLPIFTTPLPAEDIFALLSPGDVRLIRKHQTKNLSIVIFKCIQQLFFFSKPEAKVKDFTSARNSLRILSRVLPVIFEINDDNYIDTLFWKNTLATRTTDTIVPEKKIPKDKGKERAEQTEAETEDNTDAEAQETEMALPDLEPTPVEKFGPGDPLNIPLGRALLETLFRIAFLPTFSIPHGQYRKFLENDSQDSVTSSPDANTPSDYERTFSSIESDLLWETGIGTKEPITHSSTQMLQNRNDVLRCLLCCFSKTLYADSGSVETANNRFLDIATSSDMPHSATLFFSMLNTICSYNPTGSLPYSTVLLSDPKEEFVKYCLLILNVVLDYKKGQGSNNAFLKYAGQIKEWKDIKFASKGFEVLLNNHLFANTTYLPSSQKMIDFSEELLVLFWKILEENHEFRVGICRMGESNKVLIPILYYISTYSGDRAKFAYIQMCTFILLLLSGEREFSVSLNRNVVERVPFELPLIRTPNYCDLLVIVLQRTIAGDRNTKHLRTLYDCMLTIICNVSPYIKSLDMLSSVKLVKLIEMFSIPRFLFATENNPQHVLLLLQTLSNIVQYQYQGNAHVVYAILRKAETFRKLARLQVQDTPSEEKPSSTSETQESDTNVPEGESSPPSESSDKHKSENDKDEETTKPESTAEVPEVVTVKKEPHTRNTAPAKESNGFVATKEWFAAWKDKFGPYLMAILAMTDYLIPEIEHLSEGSVTEEEVLSFLQATTMVGILPVPHPILIRKYHPNANTDRWLTTYIWGLVYLQTLYPPLFDPSTIKLFSVNIPEQS